MAGPELQAGLKQRHLTMIAIGGVIGAGLFVGSGAVMAKTGPGAFLTYAITGVVIMLVMRMLGEMAAANPSTGSFADYARLALGNWAGFSVAWLYWYFWVIVVGFEAVAGAKLIQYWFDAPLWMLSLLLMVLMTATNMFSVASYGEFEYWFAGIKVFTIVTFLVLGSLFVLGLWPGRGMDFSNLTAHGGFLPNGPGVLFSGVVVVIFSMVGAEIATIAAAESDDPVRGVTKAVNTVVWRIALFFVGSVFLLCTILPWNSPELGQSPYVSALKHMGLPYADHIMNAVVLTSVLSCLNSGLYTASRMIFVLAGRREAPQALLRTSGRGVPRAAILFSTIVGFLSVIAAYVSPDKVFNFLLNSSGAVILFTYVLIAFSQLVLRRRTPESKLRVKMWGYPWLTIASIVAMIAVLVSMVLDPESRPQITLGLLSWAFLLIVFFVVVRTRREYQQQDVAADGQAHRVLVLVNDDVASTGLIKEVGQVHAAKGAAYYVCVPANPVETGTALTTGAFRIDTETQRAAQARLDATLASLNALGYDASGKVGDFNVMDALDAAVCEFGPDAIVVVTQPGAHEALIRDETVPKAREAYRIPVYELTRTTEAAG